MIYRLGRRFAFIRKWYYKLTGKYKWGYMGSIEDYGCFHKSNLHIDFEELEELEEYSRVIFGSQKLKKG